MATAVEQAQEIINEALGRALNVSDKGAIATKWYVIVEFMGESGEKFLFRLSDEDSTVWDRVGLLSFALDQQANEED